jgi:hypothetical protein
LPEVPASPVRFSTPARHAAYRLKHSFCYGTGIGNTLHIRNIIDRKDPAASHCLNEKINATRTNLA